MPLRITKIHGKFWLRLSPGKNIEVNLQNWKDNSGCLPAWRQRSQDQMPGIREP